jgi:DNA-binding response OmpR family regulator
MHALIIEDEFLIAALLEEELRSLGYDSFDIVDTQAGAIDAAERTCPDIITADDQLIEGSGIAAVAHICAAKTIPVVYILGDPDLPRDLLPFAYTTAKPFTLALIEEAVAAAIVQARQHPLPLSAPTGGQQPEP